MGTVTGTETLDPIALMQQELANRDTVLAAMSEGVMLIERGGRISYTNRAATAVLGTAFETADDLSPGTLHQLVGDVRAATEAGAPDPYVQVQMETRSGSLVEATAVGTSGGAVVVLLRDVTRSAKLERQRRDFVASASHELKTPVASILALTETLRTIAREDPDHLPGFLARLVGEAERLAALVSDLLELSRLEAGVPSRGHVRVDRVVEVVVDQMRQRAQAAGVSMAVEVPSPVMVFGSERDLAHLVHNLLDNAVRYTPSGGAIRAAVTPDDTEALITVEDTGVGIPADDIDRIFERFYRVDTARSRQTGGTGLGLSIVRHVAESHGGTVRCSSRLGAGSLFAVRLPLSG